MMRIRIYLRAAGLGIDRAFSPVAATVDLFGGGRRHRRGQLGSLLAGGRRPRGLLACSGRRRRLALSRGGLALVPGGLALVPGRLGLLGLLVHACRRRRLARRVGLNILACRRLALRGLALGRHGRRLNVFFGHGHGDIARVFANGGESLVATKK